MKKFTQFISSTILFLLLISCLAFALPDIIVESFDYPEGSLSEQGSEAGGWGGAWGTITTGMMEVLAGNMDIDFQQITTVGNYLEVSESATVFRNLAETWPDDGSTYWISMLYRRVDGYDVDDSYNGLSLFYNSTELLYIGKPWATKKLGLDGSGVENVSSEIDAYDGGWMVVKLVMSGDSENDDAFLWINTDPTVEPDTANADVHVGWKGSNGFNRVRIGSGNDPSPAECVYDEIRFSQTFGGLVAESQSGVELNTPRASFKRFGLKGNYPNPFNPETNISFILAEKQETDLSVYDMLGRKICTLINGVHQAGEFHIKWNGLDEFGNSVPSGIYFSKLTSGSQMEVKKMTLIQ